MLPLLFAHTAYGDINAELIEAAQAGNAARVEQLLKQGADVDAKNNWGGTALWLLAKGGHTETLKVLIAAGADVNAESNDSHTALTFATERHHTEIVEILKQAGARQ